MAVSDYGYCWQLWIRPTELFFFFSPLELDLISVLGRQNLGLHAVYALLSEKTMAPHFSTLAWKIPWMEEPGGLQFMGSLRVGHEWATSFSLFTFTFHLHALEKDIATHSSIPAWRIPGIEEPGGLPSMGSHRAGHNWSDLAAAAGSWKAIVHGVAKSGTQLRD